MKTPKYGRRKLRQLTASALAFLTLAGAAAPAKADPVSISAAIILQVGAAYAGAVITAVNIASYLVTSAALSYVAGAFTKPAGAGYSSAALSDRSHMIRSPVAPRNVVYGRSMVSGPMLFAHSTNVMQNGAVAKGGENGYLHLVVALAGHEIDGVEEIYLGDEPLGALDSAGFATGGKFGSIVENQEFTTKVAVPANATTISFTGYPAKSIIGLVEDGKTAAQAPGGGEGGTDSLGRPLLPNGGTAATDLTYTLSADGKTLSFAAVNRARNLTVTYISNATRSYVRAKIHRGENGQAADAALVAECPDKWTWAHKLTDIAYLYLRLDYSAKVFPNGIPNIKALVRGKRVRDPRKSNYPNDTPTWTANYALCVLDYLKMPEGLNCADSDIDLAQVKTSANVCDELVTIGPAPFNQPFGGGETQRRYEVNGSLLLDHDPEANLRSLSTAGGGPVPLLVNGKFQIPVGYYSAPTTSGLTASDLRGPVKVRPRNSRKDLFNCVGGTYVDGRVSWQPTDFPPVVNAYYESQDGGERIKRDVTLPFTTHEVMAQRLAKIMLERARQALTIEWPGKPGCFRYTVGDLVPVTLDKFGWNQKVFRVIAWNMQTDCSVDMVLQEDAPGIYDWNSGMATWTDLAANTNLPDPGYIAPMGALTVYSDAAELVMLGDGTAMSRIHVLWPASSDPGVTNGGEFEVHYKRAADAYWTPGDKVSGAATETWLSPVIDGEIYYIRVRARNNRGIESDWQYAKHTVIGNSAPPPNVAGFAVTQRADGTREFRWTTSNQPITVTNGGGYRIKYRVAGSGTAWASMTAMHNGLLSASTWQTSDPPLGTYDFAIVAVSSNRKESTPAFITNFKIGYEPISANAAVNLVPNSDWQLHNGQGDFSGIGGTLEGRFYRWSFGWFDGGANGYAGAGYPQEGGRNYTPWNPGKGGIWAGHITTSNNKYGVSAPATGTLTSCSWWHDAFIPVQPGTVYEFSVYANPHRCAASMEVEWYKADGARSTVKGGERVEYLDAGSLSAGAWQDELNGMYRLWNKLTAPSDATQVRIVLAKYGTNPGNTSSYAFFNKVMMCVGKPQTTRATATPWIESAYEQVHGGSLTTASVDSLQIAREAATSIVSTPLNGGQWLGTSYYGPYTGIGSTAYTAPVDCDVTVIYEATLHNVWQQGPSGGVTLNVGGLLQLGYNGWENDADGRSKQYFSWNQPDTYTVRGERKLTMSAGQWLGFYLSGRGGQTGPNTYVPVIDWARIQVEAVKR